MELAEAMRMQNACRYYRDDPVPDEVLHTAVELARFAPNGGNRGAVRCPPSLACCPRGR
ncbi:MAG TPA: nitroreductase family protein [Trebonia sp.]